MNSRPFSFSVAVLSIFSFLMASCATIISGTTKDISVASTPAGATVTVAPGGHRVTTPGTLTLRRNGGPYRLLFEKDGYEPAQYYVLGSPSRWFFIGFFLIPLIGPIVDLATGAYEDPRPGDVEVTLKTQATSQ